MIATSVLMPNIFINLVIELEKVLNIVIKNTFLTQIEILLHL